MIMDSVNAAPASEKRADNHGANESEVRDTQSASLRQDSISSMEKDQSGIQHVEDGFRQDKFDGYREKGLTDEDAHFLLRFRRKEETAIYRKVDCRVVPLLALLYLISHLDRANIGKPAVAHNQGCTDVVPGNAKIEGLEASLNMTGEDYNIAVAMFFIPYILCEVPSNMILAKFKRPSQYIGIIVTCWGTIVTLTGCVNSLASLCATRFLIGLFEAGFFPGAVWLISQWYPPNRTQSRNALFYLSSAIAGAFSGLLAAGIAQMDGIGGYEG